MRISDWSSEVCSSDLYCRSCLALPAKRRARLFVTVGQCVDHSRNLDVACADCFTGPLPCFAVGELQEQLGVATAEHEFGKLGSIAMAHLADRLKGQDNRGPKLPSLGQQARDRKSTRLNSSH